jgi:Secretion system C-terminal sorting domain
MNTKKFYMKKSFILIVLSVVLSAFNAVQAQKMSQICGTHDQHSLTERLAFNREQMEKGIIVDNMRGAKKYVPLKFHIIGKTDKSGRVSEAKIYENLCQLNKDYADQDIVFYLARFTNGEYFNYIDDNNAFTNQSNGLGKTVLNLAFKNNKNAINLFLAKETPSPGSTLGGTTLGYYSPTDDWLVIRNDQVNNTSGTISHELGHYFSLPHPFKGWDQEACAETYKTEWNSGLPFQVTKITAPDGFTPVECHDKSNCKTAGDRICDTPADYNFGFGWNGCTEFTKVIKDPCGTLVNPEETLFMGYFIGCKNYIFTTDQKALVSADYLSAKRLYIRPNYTPTIVDVNVATALTYPANGATTDFFNNITLDWDDVPNADGYIVEIDQTASIGTTNFFTSYVTKTSNLNLTTLVKDKKYYWRVLPVSFESGTCLEVGKMAKGNFRTAAIGVGVQDIKDVADWSVSPNPVNAGNTIFVDIQAASPFKAKIALVNAVGQIVQNVANQEFIQGGNRVELSTQNIPAGVYFVTMKTDNAMMNKKIVVMK